MRLTFCVFRRLFVLLVYTTLGSRTFWEHHEWFFAKTSPLFLSVFEKMLVVEHRFYQVVKRDGDICHICVVPGLKTRLFIEAGMLASHKRLKKLHLDLRIVCHR
jgi:hypothetical protein